MNLQTIRFKKTLLYIVMALSFVPIFYYWHIPKGIEADAYTLSLIYFNVIASIIGLCGLMLIFWQHMLGYRRIAARLTIDLIGLNSLHKFIGTYGILVFFTHPIFALLSYGDGWLELLFPKIFLEYNFYVYVGEAAMLLLAIIWLTSAIIRAKLHFRLWKAIHFLVYIILPLGLLHSMHVGSVLTSTPLIWYWYFLLAIYCILLIYRILFQYGFDRKKYTVARTTKITADVTKIDLHPDNTAITPPQPGQFMYIQLHSWGESHPFTISHYNADNKTISISPKIAGKFTIIIQAIATGSEVKIDGPYGVFTSEAQTSKRPIVCIVGGIGITPFLRIFNNAKQPVTLFYANKTKADIAYLADLSELQKHHNNLSIIHAVSREDVNEPGFEKGRVSVEMLTKHLGTDLSKYEFFICGPTEFMKSMKTILHDIKVPHDQVHIEEFAL